MKAKQATVKPKLVSQLEKHACFCPPTKHDTKLDQLNKAKEKQALSRQSPRQATSKRVMKPVLHLLVQGRPMLLFLLSWLIITKVMT